MDKPSAKIRAEHVLKAIASIDGFIEGIDEAAFLNDIKLQSAVQFQFLIIGEAIGHIDHAIREKYDYPWHIPRSFRNFIIHEYHGVKMERIFYAAKDLKALEKIMKQILKKEF